jgi:hypothetical protein
MDARSSLAERFAGELPAHRRSRRAAKLKPVGSGAELDLATVLFCFPNDEEQSSRKDYKSRDHNPDHYASSNCSIRRYAHRLTRTTATATATVTTVPARTGRRRHQGTVASLEPGLSSVSWCVTAMVLVGALAFRPKFDSSRFPSRTIAPQRASPQGHRRAQAPRCASCNHRAAVSTALWSDARASAAARPPASRFARSLQTAMS